MVDSTATCRSLGVRIVTVIFVRMLLSLPLLAVILTLKGDSPSGAEGLVELALIPTVDLLLAHARGPVRLPSPWFVVDIPQPDAAACGETVMLSRGMLESDLLAAVLAHEPGHLNTGDGKLTAAINRLIINPPTDLRAGTARVLGRAQHDRSGAEEDRRTVSRRTRPDARPRAARGSKAA